MAYVDVGGAGMHWPSLVYVSAGSTLVLDADEEHLALVFPIPKTGTLKKIGWRISAVNSPDLTLKVSVETVANAVGMPVATDNASKTLYAANAESADIVNPAAGVRFDAINGTTGVAVTKGDLVAVTIRCTALTSGSVTVAYDQHGNIAYPREASSNIPYWYTYLGGAAALGAIPCHNLTLEYDGEFVPSPCLIPVIPAISSVTWDSAGNPDRRGLKVTPPFTCKVRGVWLYADIDQDTQLIAYDSDEYTVMTGFPITLDKDQRRSTGGSVYFIEFPTTLTLTGGSAYRFVLLPSTTTPNILIYCVVPADDGAILGMSALVGGTSCAYTTFNGTPASYSHTWSDDTTTLPSMALAIDQIDIPSSGGGSSPRFGDMTGGLR